MEVSKIEVEFDGDDDFSITYTPTAEGIVVKQTICDDIEFVLDNDMSIIAECESHSYNLTKVFAPTSLELTVYVTTVRGELTLVNLTLVHKDWDLPTMLTRHKEYMENADIDEPGVFVVNHHYDTVVTPYLAKMVQTYRNLKKEKKVSGQECPVLHIPLTAKNSVILKKCEHVISKEAWSKIVWCHVPQLPTYKPCPMCRCKYESSEDWE